MLGAVIRNGNNTLVVELPTGTMDLQTKLSSIGVQKTADCIPISDEDGDQIRVKLYASSPEEAHLLSLLTAERSLSDANLCCEMLQRTEQKSLPRLKGCLLADSYHSLADYIEDAKKVFAEAAQRDVREEALAKFESDPNIRLVVSCAHEDGIDVLTLPMSERDCVAACSRLEEYGEGAVLKIEACRYNRPWNEIFGTVLQDEGLYALNNFAAAFPYMEDLQAYEAIVEYAGVTDSRSLIKLADHIDDFEFYPGVYDAEDVAREWLSNQPYLQLSAELEEYFDFDGYGNELQDEYHGQFVSNGYVFMPEGHQLDDILDTDEDMDFQ